MKIPLHDWWAKTDDNELPALSLVQHSLNVGAVAAELIARLRLPLPEGAICAAVHDVGKLGLSFAGRCPKWVGTHPELKQLSEQVRNRLNPPHGTISAFAISRVHFGGDPGGRTIGGY